MAGGSEPTRDDIAGAIARLPEAEKLVMAAIYYEGASANGLAEVLGVTSRDADALHERGVLRVAGMLGVEPASVRDWPGGTSDAEAVEAPAVGRAEKGSQRRMQEWVEHHRDLLEDELRRWPSLAEFASGPVQWRSPLRRDLYREVRDDLWKVLELPGPTPQEAGWWPRRGPVWDAVGLIPGREQHGVLLVEAKSHTAELKSGRCRATPDSMRTIEAALTETKNGLGVAAGASWTDAYYQVANRLAFLWYMRVEREIPTWLGSVYFLGDRFVSGGDAVVGPTTPDGWTADLGIAYETLGLSAGHALSDYTRDLFLPAEPRS
jgi:hypothetical protein